MRRTLRLSAIVAICLLFMSYTFAMGEEQPIPVEDQSGWFGVYENGAKIGHAKWSIANRNIGDMEYYDIEMEESFVREKSGKEREYKYTYDAKVTNSLSAKEIEYTEKKGGRKGGSEAKAADGEITLMVEYGGRPMPPQKVKIKGNTTWSFCAPLCWTWRAPETDGTHPYRRVHPMITKLLEDQMSAETKTIEFQGEDTDVVSWTSESGLINIVTDGTGNLLYHTEKNTNGVEMKYVREDEELATSPYTWEQKAAKDKPKKNNNGGGNKNNIGEGNPFSDDLDPVADDAENSQRGRYFKFDLNQGITFSMPAADGWVCGMTNQNPPRPVVQNTNEQSQLVWLRLQQAGDDEAEFLLDDFLTGLVDQGALGKLEYEWDEDIKAFDVDGADCAASKFSFIANNNRSMGVVHYMHGSNIDAILIFTTGEADFDSASDDVYAMLGAARLDD